MSLYNENDKDYCPSCKVCHGPLYICESFSEDKKLEKESARLRLQEAIRTGKAYKEIEKTASPQEMEIIYALYGRPEGK